ncbi:MAG: hypothetical protein E7212_08400 [Clostridium sartagoforme]|nr:hypothetical protein [Clostridium sartagoforme]
MEIRFKNVLGDLEIFTSYIPLKVKWVYNLFWIIKPASILIPVTFGVYNSIVESNIKYFFIQSIIETIILWYLVFKIEPKFRKNFLKKFAKYLFNNDKFYKQEKILKLSNNGVNIKVNNKYINIKFNKNTIVDEYKNHILIFSKFPMNLKYKIIIPVSIFENEIKKREFINELKSRIII